MNPKKHICIILPALLIMLFASGVFAQSRPHQIPIDSLEAVEDQEEYEVLTALLKAIYPFPQYERYYYCLQLNRESLGFGAICQPSRAVYLWEFFPRMDSTIPIACIESFSKVNEKRYRLKSDFWLSTPYRWADYGHPLNERCSNTISMSRPGFDKDSVHAIAVYSIKWEHRGSDAMAHLAKVNGVWQVLKLETYMHSD